MHSKNKYLFPLFYQSILCASFHLYNETKFYEMNIQKFKETRRYNFSLTESLICFPFLCIEHTDTLNSLATSLAFFSNKICLDRNNEK